MGAPKMENPARGTLRLIVPVVYGLDELIRFPLSFSSGRI